jgi:hypothetical protein
MKILMAYGSALSRIDDMKLMGGVSGGRTGKEILDSMVECLPSGAKVRTLTNSWVPLANLAVTKFSDGREHFRTWEEYQQLLYGHCHNWKPDIVICAPAVSNYTPRYVVEEFAPNVADGKAHVPCVKGKVDSRHVEELLVKFKKTPNILGGVRHRIGEDAVLVGFKLTSHGDLDKLIEHAQHVLEESRADVVVANDLELGLGRKFFVTPVGWWEGDTKDIAVVAKGIWERKHSGFYRSRCRADVEPDHKNIENKTPGTDEAYTTASALWDRLGDQMKPHGCLAVRIKGGGFVTTTRGKSGLHEGVRYTGNTYGSGCLTAVWAVDHTERTVLVGHHQFSQEKATLNAPLLAKMFELHPDVKVIVHLHRYLKNALTTDYAPPGTVAEMKLAHPEIRAFNIQGHGSIATFVTDDVDRIMRWVKDPETWA